MNEIVKTETRDEIKRAVESYLNSKLSGQLTNEQKQEFIAVCIAYGLNPLLREAYAIPYKGQMSIITGYEVYLKRAERCQMLAGWEVECSGSGAEMCATVTIWRKDWEHPFKHSVELKEYHAGNAMWNNKPKTMLKKVAIAQGFRLCFPDVYAGLPYCEEERGEVETEPKEDESPNKKLLKKLQALGLSREEIAAFAQKFKLSEDKNKVFNFLVDDGLLEMKLKEFMDEREMDAKVKDFANEQKALEQ